MMTNKEHRLLKERYKRLLSLVREVVNKHDPAGIMISPDAPEDEYDQEVARILPLLTRNLSQHELSREIDAIFSAQFNMGKAGSGESFEPLAEELLSVVKRVEST